MKRLALGAVSVVIVVGIAVVVAALSLSRTTIAWADLKQALLGVSTIHMTGEAGTMVRNQELPMAEHKDKWMRREPFAFYEEVTPARTDVPELLTHHAIVAGNADRVCWYFPQRGNRAVISGGMHGVEDLMGDTLGAFEKPTSSKPNPGYRVVGRVTIDGNSMLLIEAPIGDGHIELAVDAKTKLTRRIRQYTVGPDGKQVDQTLLYFEYNKPAPEGVFDWQPPAGAIVVDKRRR